MSPKAKVNTERVNVFFSQEQMELVKKEAQAKGLTVSAYIRMVTVKEADESNRMRIVEKGVDKIKENGEEKLLLDVIEKVVGKYPEILEK